MGLFDYLFHRPRQVEQAGLWKTLSAYTPAFTSWDGQMYESDLVRSAIDALARHSAKLEITVNGTAQPKLRGRLKAQPNPFMTWYQYHYRARTILEVQNNCFIVPVYDDDGTVCGFFPILPSQSELVDVNGEPWLRYTFLNGTKAALPFDECGVLTRHQYKDDFFGEKNTALGSTLDLIHMQKQGVKEGITNGATFRFMAKLGNFAKPEDVAMERKRFNANNLQGESGGLLLFPNTYTDIKQIDQKPYTVDAEQMKLIQTNVSNYFGVSEEVLQNRCYGDAWSAFYEGAIEPYAIQASEVHTAMAYSARERATGNSIFFTSNRLQYMTNADKLNVSAQLVDRGVFSRNDARALWNLPPIEGGDEYIVRSEYVAANNQITPGTETDNMN